jgi:hypothetical protein
LNNLYMVRKSHSLRLAAVGILLMALVLAQGLGIGFGPAHTAIAQESTVLSSTAQDALGQPTPRSGAC